MPTDGSRVSVQTYISASQRDRWREEADEMDMSQAEYVRTMVQAGRRGFDLYTESDRLNTNPKKSVQPDPDGVTPGGNGMKEQVIDVLHETEFADWDELLAGVTDDIEERLEETLDELQSADRIRYSGRHGGYTVVGDER